MEFRVEDLASQAGVSVDTVRFYQGRGLLPPPRREGRVALYGEAHLRCMQRIRTLVEDGFSLAQVRRLFSRESEATSATADEAHVAQADAEPLLDALVEEGMGGRSLSRAELARESGMPEPMLASMQSGGLLEPLVVAGQERFSEADLEMCRAGLAILETGLPLPELLELAVEHARSIERVAQKSIDLFDDHVRRGGDPSAAPLPGSGQAIEKAFRALLPQVTRLVALHFQRTLVRGAIERLRTSGDAEALEEALAATEGSRLEVAWR